MWFRFSNDMGKFDLAALDYDQAIRLAPDDGGLFIDRGKIFDRNQNSTRQSQISLTRSTSTRNGLRPTESAA